MKKKLKPLLLLLVGALSLQACRIQSGMITNKPPVEETSEQEDEVIESSSEQPLKAAPVTSDSLLTDVEAISVKLATEIRIPRSTNDNLKTYVVALDGKLFQAIQAAAKPDAVDSYRELGTDLIWSNDNFIALKEKSTCRGQWQPIRDESF